MHRAIQAIERAIQACTGNQHVHGTESGTPPASGLRTVCCRPVSEPRKRADSVARAAEPGAEDTSWTVA